MLSALENNPEDEKLRLHLAGVLLSDGDAQAALEHFRHVLSDSPAHEAALRGAARAARTLGDDSAASGYEQLLKALGSVFRTMGEASFPSCNEDNSGRAKLTIFKRQKNALQ